jgi:hypothetical protein
MVRLADVRRLAGVSAGAQNRDLLDQFLHALEQRLPSLSDSITALYFRSADIPHQLLRLRTRSER